MRYTVEKDLSIADEFHHRHISPELLVDFDYPVDTDQSLLYMATLLIRASNNGAGWLVSATALGVDLYDTIQVGEIRCEVRTPREAVLPLTYEWMRDSPTTLFIPARPVEQPIVLADRDYFLCAFGLIRTKDCIMPPDLHPEFDSRAIRG
jgi:hypothetical protein